MIEVYKDGESVEFEQLTAKELRGIIDQIEDDLRAARAASADASESMQQLAARRERAREQIAALIKKLQRDPNATLFIDLLSTYDKINHQAMVLESHLASVKADLAARIEVIGEKLGKVIGAYKQRLNS